MMRNAETLPLPLWRKLQPGDVVWLLFFNDDTKKWEIEQELVTAVGYKGFWFSGFLEDPLAAETLTEWQRIGVDAFLTEEEAEERMRQANDV